MSEIVRHWLMNQLGLILQNFNWNEDRQFILLTSVLKHYDLLTDDQVRMIEGKGLMYESTLTYMCHIINNLGIAFTRDDLSRIQEGVGSITLRLFYELYLALHDKTKIYFLVEKEINKTKPGRTRFSVDDSTKIALQIEKFDNPLAKLLAEKEDAIEFNKGKVKELTDQIKQSREAYMQYVSDRNADKVNVVYDKMKNAQYEESVEKLCSDAHDVNLTVEDLLEEEKKAKELECLEPDSRIAKKIIHTIKQKRRKFEQGKEMKEKYQKLMSKDLWDKIVAEQEEYFKEEFAKKLLRQSTYEEQMVTKLFEVRQHRDNMHESRFQMMKYIQREEEKHWINDLLNQQNEASREKMRYYIERDRNLELHDRLYKEKMKRKADKHYNICLKCAQDLVDIAIYKANARESLGIDISKKKERDLANLFFKEQPIFDILDDVSDVIKYDPEEPMDEDLETIYIQELNRQNCMDELSFYDYCKCFYPWLIPDDIDIDMDAMNLGMNVIGYVVHRLLMAKYPIRPLPPPPSIPKALVAVCINGLQNLDYLPVLSKLLSARKVKVIQMQDAINYCLAAFKDETTLEYLESAFVDETNRASETLPKGKKPKDAGKPDKKGKMDTKKKSLGSTPGEAPKTFEEKEVQTPKLFPCEELILTPAASLGKAAYEVLNLGDQPNDILMCAIFVEYLKTCKDIEGWVLVNYPQNIHQAAILEETLTCAPVPKPPDDMPFDSILDIIDLDERDIENVADREDLNQKRYSRLVENPKPKEVPYYETYLTAFIEIRSFENDDLNELYYDCFKTTDNENMLNRFYKEQGCKYTLHYKEIDFPTIKHLGKLILGDYSLPLKDSVELFTDTVNYLEAEFNELGNVTSRAEKVGTKAKKPPGKPEKAKGEKSTVAEPKSKKGDKATDKSKSKKESIRGSVRIDREDKETQIPEPPPPLELEDEDAAEPKPGEKEWTYVDVSIPDIFEVSLASLWENMENTYANDFQQLFFRRRVLLDSTQPYIARLYTKMHDFIARPDNKQEYLHQFQIIYNEFDEDLREDEEVKAEIHCRIHEFREKLWTICDNRMRESEAERKRLIAKDWTSDILFDLTNIFITFLQLEVDRCSDTMQMLMDYYMGMVTKMPNPDRRLDKVSLNIIQFKSPSDDDDKVAALNKKLRPYKLYTERVMENPDEIITNNSEFHKSFTGNVNLCMNFINSYDSAAEKVMETIVSIFNPKDKAGKGKAKPAKSSIKSDGQTLPPFLEPEPEVKCKFMELESEFASAYSGEILRAKFRIQLITHTFIEEFLRVLGRFSTISHKLFEEIQSRYDREIASVDNACSVFSRAAEAESKIQPELIFDGDKFLIKCDSLMYEGRLPEEREPVAEISDDEKFTIKQLNELVNILKDLSPYGCIPERAFVFLIQDLLNHDAEDDKPKFVPELWSALIPHKLHNFSRECFGDAEYIDWRDFIIYNLHLPFPTEQELQAIRTQFRKLDPDMTEVIYEYQFQEITFWFEDCFSKEVLEDVLKLNLIRALLLRLYKTDESRLNYTALLLAFCKDDDPVIGFAKALFLSTGKCVCWNKEIGGPYYDHQIEQVEKMKLAELQIKIEHQDNILMAEEIITDLIDTTVHRADSVVLDDYDSLKGYSSDEFSDPAPVGEPQENLLIDEAYIDNELKYLKELADRTDFMENESRTTIFTNLQQSFEGIDNIDYVLGFDTLISVLSVSLPWHAKIQCPGDTGLLQRVALIYHSYLHPDLKVVFAHKFLNDPQFVDLLNRIYKFKVKYPVEIIKTLLDI